MNLDEYESIETHWVALYVNNNNNNNNISYFGSLVVKHIPKEIEKK